MATVDFAAFAPTRFVLHGGPYGRRLTDDEFLALCHRNPALRIEADATGDLILMPPTGGGSGRRGLRVLWRRGI